MLNSSEEYNEAENDIFEGHAKRSSAFLMGDVSHLVMKTKLDLLAYGPRYLYPTAIHPSK